LPLRLEDGVTKITFDYMHPEISKGRENKSTDAGLIKHKATL
jgi:hypothetical protein